MKDKIFSNGTGIGSQDSEYYQEYIKIELYNDLKRKYNYYKRALELEEDISNTQYEIEKSLRTMVKNLLLDK